MSTDQEARVSIPWGTLAVSIVLTAVPLAAFLRGDVHTRVLVLAVALLAIGAYAATVHPVSIFVGLAVVVGCLPYIHIAGTTIPLLLVLAVATWVALPFVPGVRLRPGRCEVWVVALAVIAFVSVAMSDFSKAALIELAAWLVATAVVIPVRFLPRDARTTMVRAFVTATAAASAFGIAVLRLDPNGEFLSKHVNFAGYEEGQVHLHQVPGSGTLTTRLTSTYVEPNIAGLVLAAGVVLAVAYFRGYLRVVLAILIGAALLLTLSRAALGTLVVAGLLVVLRSSGRRRWTALGLVAAAGLAVVAVPRVRVRLIDSFGPSDTGAKDRLQALQEFSQVMADHWTWGLGWARPEFRDAALNRALNFVANAPLLTIYRGGLVLGGLVVLVLVVLVVRSWITARRSFQDAVVCCTVMAFVLVALQLDFPVVTQPPATVILSMLVGLSMHRDERQPDPPRATTLTTDS